MATPSAVNFDQDMQTIRDYVDAVVQAQTRVAATYSAALDSFQLTVQTASAAEVRPDVLGVVSKAGIKFAEKSAVAAVKDATGADLGPLVEMLHAISDEVDRASKAATSRSVAEWINSLRTSVINSYTQGNSRQAMIEQLEREYNQNDEGGRGGYIAGIQNELDATKTVPAPKVEAVEAAMYQGWINQAFNQECIDGAGILSLQFGVDGNLVSAKVVAPLGDRLAGRLNTIMGTAGISGLMDLDVAKKVCREDVCICFGQQCGPQGYGPR